MFLGSRSWLQIFVTMNVGDMGPKRCLGIIQWDTSITMTRFTLLIWGQLIVEREGFAAVLQQENVLGPRSGNSNSALFVSRVAKKKGGRLIIL